MEQYRQNLVHILLKTITPTTITDHNNNTKNNQQVFECLINTISQNTTTNQHQTHNIIQNLEFGMYTLVV